MNDLPNGGPQEPPQQSSQSFSPPSVTVGGKEGEVIPIATQELPLKAVSQEIQLPKEVTAAGVSVTPQSVTMPLPVIQAGVRPVGHHDPTVQPTHPSHVHLSDEQIARGLHEGMSTSVRWLAEWCVRQMKIVHATISNKSTHS